MEYNELIKLSREEIIKELDNKLTGSLEKTINISKIEDKDFNMCVSHIVDFINNPFTISNKYDEMFYNLMGFIWNKSEEDLVINMMKILNEIKEKNNPVYRGFVDYFRRFDLWGSFNPEYGDLTTLKLRAAALKRHTFDYIWLYRRLDDYLSKRTLYAIIANWTYFEFEQLRVVKSIFMDYWEPDLFLNNKDDVLVDCGAYTGDSIYNYVNMYGIGYKKIYAYEISPNTCIKLQENIDKAKLPNVVVKQKGVGKEPGEFYINDNTDTSANKIGNKGEVKVEVVKIDDDIKDKITFIKMDIEGAEYDALKGAEKTIRNNHPKLAICVYHGYEDIYRIPFMINEMNPNYKFYLRHNGGDLIPTEFVLLCK